MGAEQARQSGGFETGFPEDPDPLPFGVLTLDAINRLTPGGIYVTPGTFELIQVAPPSAKTKSGDRAQRLPYTQQADGAIIWHGNHRKFRASTATLGIEEEIIIQNAETGEWHEYSPTGEEIHHPNGNVFPADRVGHTAESVPYITERCNTKLFRGPVDLGKQAIQFFKLNRDGLHESGMATPGISMMPFQVNESHITRNPYIRSFFNSEKQPLFLEFAPSAGIHLNIEARTPEDGLFAINAVQILSPVLNAITAASPYRDGRIDTTVVEHFQNLQEAIGTKDEHAAKAAKEALEGVVNMMREIPDYTVTPDWRQIARLVGSPSGGPIKQASSKTITEHLQEANRQLGVGEALTGSRTLGWHSDRYCLNKGNGVVELCNLSRAGNNPRKLLATFDLAAKAVLALQEYHAQSDPEYKEEWRGIIPSPEARDDKTEREKTVEVARVNHSIASLFGRERGLFRNNAATGIDKKTGHFALDLEDKDAVVTQREILETFFDFIETFGDAVSEKHQHELRETLEHFPDTGVSLQTPDEIFAYFFSPGSRMTADEALRMAHDVEPEASIEDMLLKFDAHCDASWQTLEDDPDDDYKSTLLAA